VVETDVHFPTDSNLLFDAVRKTIQAVALLALLCHLCGWRQHKYLLRQLKKSYRHASKLKASTSDDEKKRQAREHERKKAYLDYVLSAQELLVRARETAIEAQQRNDLGPKMLRLISDIDHYGNYALKFCDQIVRRVVRDEVIPHDEKLFSIFEPHTEWISKGKAGVPQELGLKVCIVEDQYQFVGRTSRASGSAEKGQTQRYRAAARECGLFCPGQIPTQRSRVSDQCVGANGVRSLSR